jgi:hypothetical protein
MKPADLPASLIGVGIWRDDPPDDYELDERVRPAGNESSVAGFAELFYLWCMTYGVDTAAVSTFSLSPSQLTVLSERNDDTSDDFLNDLLDGQKNSRQR